MNNLLKWISTAMIVLILSKFLPGITANNFLGAFWLAVILSVLNVFVKPILLMFTLPITFLTFGLFVLIINTIIIIIADFLTPSFAVSGFMPAFWFSLILSVSQSVLFKFLDK